MKNILLSFLFFAFSFFSFSQKTFFDEFLVENFDSLLKEDQTILIENDSSFKTCNTDTCKLNVLLHVSSVIQDIEVQKQINTNSLNYIDQIDLKDKTEKERNNIKTKRAAFTGNLADNYIGEGNFDKAIEKFTLALELAKENQDINLMVDIYNSLGYINNRQEDLIGANKFYFKGLELCLRDSLIDQLPMLYLNISQAFFTLDSNEKALEYSHKCFAACKNADKPNELLTANNNMGYYFLLGSLQNKDSSLFYFSRTVEIAEEIGDLNAIYLAKGTKFSFFSSEKRFKEAEKIGAERLKIAEKIGDFKSIRESLSNMYLTKLELGKYEEALEYRNREIELKEKLGKKEDIQALSDLEANLKYENELLLKEEKAESLEKESKLKSRIITISIIGLILIAITLIFLALNRRKLNQSRIRLEELDKVNKQIFSVIAHDFKEPIINFNTLLRNISNKKRLDGELVNELESQVKSSSDVLNNLLNWARVELEKQEVNKKNLKLKDIWDKVVSTMETSIKKKELVVKNLFTESDSMEGDEVMMEIVFRNLLSNAIKFSPEGGEITLKKSKDKVEIRDQGVGMKTENKESLFKEKVNPGYGTNGEIGFGIGLYIVKNLLEKNGKSISFSANNPKGTIFAIE